MHFWPLFGNNLFLSIVSEGQEMNYIGRIQTSSASSYVKELKNIFIITPNISEDEKID